MNTRERRQILYAALLRYTPEAGSLRERALDRFILVALIGSTKYSPMTIQQVHNLTILVPKSPGLRTEVIVDTLTRLVKANWVSQIQVSNENSYFLSDIGLRKTEEETDSAALLFRPVLDRMLQDTAGSFSVEQGEKVCRTFISECFARFGHQIAKAVTGDLLNDDLIGNREVRRAFQAAINTVSLSKEAVESLRARCNRFLRSPEPQDQNLKFRLAQGYYVVQLLELSPKDFDPLAEDTFHSAVFYIDTNVLFDAVMTEESAHRFRELVTASTTLGIKLRVTEATLEEAVNVSMHYIGEMEKIINTVPDKLLERTDDNFVQAYRTAKTKTPEITLSQFKRLFEELPKQVQDLNITLDKRKADEIIGNRNVSSQCRIVSDAAEKTRGERKGENVSRHDVCHFLLVQHERQLGRKSWFLTRDRSLSIAAGKLARDELPFCFPLAGFLQSVSPFLETPDTRHTLVDVFSAVLDGEVGDLTSKSLFDITELKLISELHTDVLSVPVDQLLPAFEYVKTHLLRGKQYRVEDHPKVALELRKFLTSSSREKEDSLLEDVRRERDLVATEREKRTNAERNIGNMKEEIDRLKGEIDTARDRELGRWRKQKNLSMALAIFGGIVAFVCWWFDSEITGGLLRLFESQDFTAERVRIAVRAFGAFAFVGATIPAPSFLVKRKWRKIAYIVIIAVAIGTSDLIGPSTLAVVSSVLAIGAHIGSIIFRLLDTSSGPDPEKTSI